MLRVMRGAVAVPVQLKRIELRAHTAIMASDGARANALQPGFPAVSKRLRTAVSCASPRACIHRPLAGA